MEDPPATRKILAEVTCEEPEGALEAAGQIRVKGVHAVAVLLEPAPRNLKFLDLGFPFRLRGGSAEKEVGNDWSQSIGLSAPHANDEDIGATKPDITYERDAVDAACGTCHTTHDVPARQVVARFLEGRPPAGAGPICTDCHGSHRIARAAETR